MAISDQLNGKRILIWGYGREGKATESFCQTHAQPACIDIYEGKPEDIQDSGYDLIIKSPGIPYFTDDPRYTSETQLFLEEFRNQIIGITGTKGKSTTSSMLYHVLQSCGYTNSVLVGNIGIPCFDFIDRINPETIIVFEYSCHQLSGVSISPHIAVLLNLFEEHLDYYGTLEKYYAAKINITRYQTPDDLFFVGENAKETPTKAQTYLIDSYEENIPTNILGSHNKLNAQFVIRIMEEVLHCPLEKILPAIATFEGLPHRLQKCATVNGVDYYDDSISTIPEATISAAESIPNVRTILIGGMDRGIHYGVLIDFIEQHKDLLFLCMYDSGEKIYESLSDKSNAVNVKTLESAVDYAVAHTAPGSACVLSPAAASYGIFKNFEERGDEFKRLLLEK